LAIGYCNATNARSFRNEKTTYTSMVQAIYAGLNKILKY